MNLNGMNLLLTIPLCFHLLLSSYFYTTVFHFYTNKSIDSLIPDEFLLASMLLYEC